MKSNHIKFVLALAGLLLLLGIFAKLAQLVQTQITQNHILEGSRHGK